MAVLTNQTTTNLVADTGNGVLDWAARKGGENVNSPTPTLGSLNPATLAATAGPTEITVAGTNFVQGAQLKVGSVGCPTEFVSATQLKATFDPSVAGTFPTHVTQYARLSNAVNFTVT